VKLIQQGLLAPKQEPQLDLQQRARPWLEQKQLAQLTGDDGATGDVATGAEDTRGTIVEAAITGADCAAGAFGALMGDAATVEDGALGALVGDAATGADGEIVEAVTIGEYRAAGASGALVSESATGADGAIGPLVVAVLADGAAAGADGSNGADLAFGGLDVGDGAEGTATGTVNLEVVDIPSTEIDTTLTRLMGSVEPNRRMYFESSSSELYASITIFASVACQ
jgi:hypothetical protein